MKKVVNAKKIIGIILAGLVLVAAAVGIFVLARAHAKELMNWEDESLEVDLYSKVTVSSDPVYDAEGNAYHVRALVSQTDGAFVNVLNGSFRADYAGGYRIVYTLADENIKADSRTVTVRIKNGDTPAPYFKKTQLVVYEDTKFGLPEYGCALDPEIGIEKETLELYKLAGESREKADADLSASEISLPAGNYVFTLKITAKNGKTGEAELPFRVRSENERGAIASLNDANSNRLAISYWDTGINGWKLASTYFTPEVYRNEYVSLGSVYSEMPGTAGTGSLFITPEISKDEFVSTMSKEGAVVSVWMMIKSEDGEPRTISYGKKSMEAQNGLWTNVRITAEDAGYQGDLEKFYFDLAVGNYKLIEIQNPVGEPYTVYFDSIYVSEPITAEFPEAACNYGEKVTLKAASQWTEDFYYELYDITEEEPLPQMSGDGTFTSRVAGTLHAMAYPIANRYYADLLMTTVTVNGNTAFGFEKNRMTMESGWNTRPKVKAGFGKGTVSYRIVTINGSECYSYLQDSRIRIFEGEYILYGEAKRNGIVYSAYLWITGNKAPVDRGDIENFDNPSSMENVTTPQHFTYVGDYEGASGVVKFNAGKSGVWPGFFALAPQTSREELVKSFSSDDFMAIRFRVENMPHNYYLYYTVEYGAKGLDTYVAHISNGWQTHYIPASEFFDNYDKWFDKGRLCFTNNVDNEAEIYVDWIKLVKGGSKKAAQDENSVEYQNYSDPRAAMVMARKCEGMPLTWQDSYQGASGLLKITTTIEEAWPTIWNFQPKLSRQQYLDLGYGEGDIFKIRIYNANDYEGYTAHYCVTGKSENNTLLGNLKKGWNELSLDASIILDHFDAFSDGTAYIVFSQANKPVMHELYLDSMYFEKRSQGVQTGDKADFVNLQDSDNWKWYFATKLGQEDCSYDASGNAIHFAGSGPWPGFGGFIPAASKEDYEKFRNELFVVELDITSCTGQWNDPKLYFKDKEKKDIPYATIRQPGKIAVEIPASVILDNWETVLNGESHFFFYDGGGTVDVDCRITGMYFTKGIGVTVDERGVITTNGGSDTYTIAYNGQTLSPRADGTYYLGDFAEKGRESYDIVATVTRRNAAGGIVAQEEIPWSTPAAEYEINCLGSTAGRKRIQDANGMRIEYLKEKTDSNGVTKKDVVKVDFEPVGSPWPAIRFGAPLCRKPAEGTYNYVVFTMYVEDAPNNLVLDYKNQENNELLTSFPVKKGWAEYWVPLAYFDYDKVAAGTQFFVAYTDGNVIRQKLYLEGIRYANREEPDPKEENVINDFAAEEDMDRMNLANGGIYDMKYLAEKEDAAGVAKQGVVALDLALAESPWPAVKFGTPFCQKPENGAYDYVVFTMCAEGDVTNLVLDYKNTANERLHWFKVQQGWKEYRLPVEKFDFDAFAGGEQFLVAYTDGNLITHKLYIDDIRYEKKSAQEVPDRVDFINFKNGTDWEARFATVGGQEFCTYIVPTGSGLHYTSAYGPWPGFGGFTPIGEKAAYEKFQSGNFVIEMDVASYRDQWGSEFYPQLYLKSNKVDTQYAVIDHTGKYTIKIPAAVVLDRWNEFLSGTDYFFLYDGGGNVSMECDFTGMYFEKGSDGAADYERENFIDFTKEVCQEQFATAAKDGTCTYVSAGENAIRYQASAEWPNLAGFAPDAEREICELLRDGKFVIEMDVASYSDSWGEGCYPKLYFKDANNADTEYAVINRTGKYTVEIPASVILDNWEVVLDGSAYFFFGDWGATVGVDCKFTGMYFAAKEETTEAKLYKNGKGLLGQTVEVFLNTAKSVVKNVAQIKRTIPVKSRMQFVWERFYREWRI